MKTALQYNAHLQRALATKNIMYSSTPWLGRRLVELKRAKQRVNKVASRFRVFVCITSSACDAMTQRVHMH